VTTHPARSSTAGDEGAVGDLVADPDVDHEHDHDHALATRLAREATTTRARNAPFVQPSANSAAPPPP
jgi:hypothetical protein